MAGWEGKHDVAALAETLRRRLAASPNVQRTQLGEKRMFGGVCFLLRNNMLCGAGKNGYMVRTDPLRAAEAAALPGGAPVVMQGRAMKGFYWVDPEACDARSLGRWLALAEEYVGRMPAKAAKRRRAAARPREGPAQLPDERSGIPIARGSAMKNFVFAYYGVPKFETPAAGKQHMAKWKAWVDGLGDALIDPGKPVAAPKNVSARGVCERAGPDRFTGYSVVQAGSMEAALAMAQRCPHLEHGTIDVAEVMAMAMKP